MAEKSKIEWTDATWNPITGCTLVSEGCRHCYAARLAASGRLANHPSRKGLARINAAGEAKFTGEVRFNEGWLDQPLRWRRGRMIFVCAHGDLFHEGVPDEWLDRIFAVMGEAPQHTFQVLTKRPERARDYLTRRRAAPPVQAPTAPGLLGWHPFNRDCLPPRNVWIGTSVEDQATADARVPALLETPAAVRFLSAEPLLGSVDLTPYLGTRELHARYGLGAGALAWVIVGGESGPHARPMHPDWARAIRDQCEAAGVAFHFKQWGEWLPFSQVRKPEQYAAVERTTIESNRTGNGKQTYFGKCFTRHPDGQHITATTPGIRPEQINMIGKTLAGRLLDGREHNGMPG